MNTDISENSYSIPCRIEGHDKGSPLYPDTCDMWFLLGCSHFFNCDFCINEKFDIIWVNKGPNSLARLNSFGCERVELGELTSLYI